MFVIGLTRSALSAYFFRVLHEEHNRLIQAQIEKINLEKFEERQKLLDKHRQELSEIKEGIYAVRYYFYLTVYTNERGAIKGVELYKGNFFAKSGYDAYEKTVEYLTNKFKYNARVAHLQFPHVECGEFQFEYIKYHLAYYPCQADKREALETILGRSRFYDCCDLFFFRLPLV